MLAGWKWMAGLWTALLWWIPAVAGADLGPILGTNELAHLDRALARLNMNEADLGFEKDMAKPVLALDWVRKTLAHPLDLPPIGDRIIRVAASNSAPAVWALAATLLEAEQPARAAVAADEAFADAPALNPRLAGSLREFVNRAGVALGGLTPAYAAVTAEELGYAAASILGEGFNAEDHAPVRDALSAAGISTQQIGQALADGLSLDTARAQKKLIGIMQRVKLGAVLAAGETFHDAVAGLERQAAQIADWPDKPVVLGTRMGPIVIGTRGNDVYTNAAFLILDPGGNDRYGGEAGVANGLKGQSLSAIVDLGGDDVYASETLLAPGSALSGLAVVMDGAGNDRYEATYAGQGAALFGASWLDDKGGDDEYKAGGFAQGAAVVGMGVLRDGAGNDVYNIGLCGQGYAGVRGAGFLLEREGNDRYLAGNREPDWERYEDRFLSMAQGFAIGVRPLAGGGVAALVDLKGNDTYVADVYGQGVSYWYSAGFLLDGEGNDTYRLYHYGQGSGIHLSLGLLADFSGKDSYSGFGLVQGNAHDYAVGMLFDHQGNDTYTGETSAQGRAINNSFALLVDSGGDDAYFGRLVSECQAIGNDGGSRGYGSLAVLLDLGGKDVYSCGATNGGMLCRPSFGVLYDAPGEGPK